MSFVPFAFGADADASHRAARLEALLAQHPEPTFTLDLAGCLRWANPAFARLVGLAEPAALVGRPFPSLVPAERRDAMTAALADMRDALVAGDAEPASWRLEFEGPDGALAIAHVSVAPVALDGVPFALQGSARDVTVFEVLEEQLHARTFTDPLTGLANRTQFEEQVGRALRRAQARAEAAADGTAATVAVLVLDLDDFQLVNDGFGAAAGDRLLLAVTERLRRATRGGDVVARLGGDTFAVLLDALGAAEDVTIVVGRLHAALHAPFDVGGPADASAAVRAAARALAVSASVGVAVWDGGAAAPELLQRAELAMARVRGLPRAGGGVRHAVYDDAMQSHARDRLELAGALREALRAGAVVPAFQPIVDLRTGVVVKAEALARWTDPVRGPVSPGVFVPLAEELGLIGELGAQMLRAGCVQLRAWHDAGWPIGLTVNVSGRQLEQGRLLGDLRAALDASGADPRALTIELTESVAMHDPARVGRVLREVTALGVSVAIDDFGTGYSSLAHLHRFPARTIKIDRSFVERLAAAPDDEASDEGSGEALVRTIVGMAGSLGMDVVAEGVETAEQRDVLLALGCRFGQGWLFGRPVAGEVLLAGQGAEAGAAASAVTV